MAITQAVYDVLVVGAGPAGLSMALGLARQLYSAVVFDSQQYRNGVTERMHNVITWDHKLPVDYRAEAHADIVSRYPTIDIKVASIMSITKNEGDNFEAVDQDENKYVGKRVVLATGVKDILLDIPGYKELWGRSIFHCLFCHGFEEHGGESAGILAEGILASAQMSLHMARMVARLAKNITIYTNGNSNLTQQMRDEFFEKSLTIEARKISSLLPKDTGPPGVIVQFEDGLSRSESFLTHIPSNEFTNTLAEQLGVEVKEAIIKTVSPFYETTVPGVFAVGDCATPFKVVTQAVSMGCVGAAGLAQQLGALGKL